MTKATMADRKTQDPPLVERLRQYVEIADGDKMTVILCDDLTEAANRIDLVEAALKAAHDVFAAEIEGLHKIILGRN